MDEIADVADAMAADPGDLLVGEPVLEFEADHLALILGQGVEQAEHPVGRLADFEDVRRPGVGAHPDLHLFLAELGHPALLSQDVERPIPADGEQPLGQSPVEIIASLAAEFQERVLDDVAGVVGIAKEPRGVEGQRTLEPLDRRADPGGVDLCGLSASCGWLAEKESSRFPGR